MIHIDYQDKRPLYEQLTEKIKDLIVRGILEQDSRLPSVRNFAIDLSINPNTIQRAYLELERNGFIYTVKGRGNYVAEESFWKTSQELQMMTELNELVGKLKNLGITREKLLEEISKIYDGKETL